MMKNGSKTIIYITLILVGLYLLFFTPLKEWVTLTSLNHRMTSLQYLSQQHFYLFIAGYMALYIITNTLFIPIGVILNLSAGAIWGMPLGFFIALISTTLGATSAFLFTRLMVREFVLQLWGERINKILHYVDHRNKLYLFILRLTPMFPYSLINAAFSFTQMKATVFLLITFIGQIMVIGILTNTGTELSKLNSLKDLWSPSMLMALFFFAMTPVITTILIKRFTRTK